jgi:hypothetical protein
MCRDKDVREGRFGGRTRFVRSTVREEVEVGGGGSGSDNPCCESLSDAPYEEQWHKPYGLHSIQVLEGSPLPTLCTWGREEGGILYIIHYYYCRGRLL